MWYVFDANFLRRWFRQDSRCPVCRYNINNEDNSETETQKSNTNKYKEQQRIQQ